MLEFAVAKHILNMKDPNSSPTSDNMHDDFLSLIFLNLKQKVDIGRC
jgi:hypothetical protein